MLALIAGEGRLPGTLAAALTASGTGFLVCEMQGHPVDLPGPGHVAKVSFRLETLGSLIDDLGRRGVTQVCFAGRVSRPEIDPAKIDAATLPLAAKLGTALQSGDDAALRIITGFFEDVGIAVVGAAEIAPVILPRPGVLTRAKPSEQDERDARRGDQIITALAAADVGQACVVANGQALAVEAVAGTDWMLHSIIPPSGPRDDDGAVAWARARIARARAGFGVSGDGQARGGVLVKKSKPGQDLRFDMPTVGPETIAGLQRAQLAGLVIEADRVILLDPAATIAAADAAGLFIWVRA